MRPQETLTVTTGHSFGLSSPSERRTSGTRVPPRALAADILVSPLRSPSLGCPQPVAQPGQNTGGREQSSQGTALRRLQHTRWHGLCTRWGSEARLPGFKS